MVPELILQDEEQRILHQRAAIAAVNPDAAARQRAVQLDSRLRIIQDVRGLFHDLRQDKARAG